METITFYSYKGGTGRTLLLANAARYFALLGKRVVAMDLDFEAPGLHYKLSLDRSDWSDHTPPRRGVVDYLLQSLDSDRRRPLPLDDYLQPVPLPPSGNGQLWLMPAGSAPSGTYWKQLTSLLRRDLVIDANGHALTAILDLKARLEAERRVDLLLIDSRTGITELGGIATSVLADKVVCLFLNNQESLIGTRAVMRSLGVATRLADHGSVEQYAVLSRTSDDSASRREEALDFLNEEGPSSEETLSLRELFVLRSDPDLEEEETLHLGGEPPARRSPLHRDYLFLVSSLTTAEPEQSGRAWSRREAVQGLLDWLTESYEGDRGWSPKAFSPEQLAEGVQLGGHNTRYADVVAFSGEDRAEALIAAEYVESDLEGSDAWKWWERNTRLRCLILFGSRSDRGDTRRVFTRGRSSTTFTERADEQAWSVKWPLSFTGLDDPGDRSISAMLEAVKRGDDGFISLLITEWERSVTFTLHGGAPFRPDRASQILNGLAQVRNPETEARILWRTAPDPFEGRRYRGFRGEGDVDEQMNFELHAPLFWRLSVEAKRGHFNRRHHPHGSGRSYGLEFLARDLLGLSLDQDRALRRLAAPIVQASDSGAEAAWDVASAVRGKELRFDLSDDVPTELVRRAFIDRVQRGERAEPSGRAWESAQQAACSAYADDNALSALLRSRDGRLDLVTTNLLGRYESANSSIILFSRAISWSAHVLQVDLRALENVVLLHETIHAVCHLGEDLDGRVWDAFSLPNSDSPGFRPDALHEGIAQYFTFRMLERLDDTSMMEAFERLTDTQPRQYQRWRAMRDVPIERVREILIAARTGLGDALASLS